MHFQHEKKNLRLGILSLLVFFLVLSSLIDIAETAVFCVNSPESLQTALNVAAINGEDNTIQVVRGTYLTPGSQFQYVSYDNFSISLLGGFTIGCESRVLNPTNTVLDGQNANRVIRIFVGSGSANIHFQGFTVRNGNVSDTFGGAGLYFGNSAGSSGEYAIDHNIFVNNNTSWFGGGLGGGSDLGVTRIENNLIVNNSAGENGGGASLGSNGTAYITNNTVSGNAAAQGNGGLRLWAGGTGFISNNIFFSNTTLDLLLISSNTVLLNNDIGTQNGSPGPGSASNVNVDPQFVGSGDFHLRVGSPLIDAGTATPQGGLSASDLEGNPRIIGVAPDIGAYEYSPISPNEGTIGTEITITGSGYGIKKGKVLIGTASLKILEWTDDSIRCLLSKALPPDTYNVMIRPQIKGSSPITIPNGFTVKAPEIDSVEPTSGSAGAMSRSMVPSLGRRRERSLWVGRAARFQVGQWRDNRRK